jgi:hypothetical protein
MLRNFKATNSVAVAAVLLTASVCGLARAADAPDVVGTWTRTEHQIAYVGQSSYYATRPDPAKMTNGADTGPTWIIKIETQDGRSFHGKMIAPTGKAEELVGAVRQDGKRFVFATASDSGSGEINGNEMESCWTGASPSFTVAGCGTFKRNK